MCTDVDCFPRMMMLTENDSIVSTQQCDRRNSWAPSTSSSNSSAPSWLERKLFSHLKRFFRRSSMPHTPSSSSSPSPSQSEFSSRRASSPAIADEIVSLPAIEQSIQTREQEAEAKEEEEEEEKLPLPSPILLDPLYDYDKLLARCTARLELDRTEMILRRQTPVSIPHADLRVGQSRTIVINWKSYLRLLRALTRDSHLFQQYINDYYACETCINQREQLTLNVRTTKLTFDNVLRNFLHDYVTCLTCQAAQTHLIKSAGIWRIECQFCGSQRTVNRLRWKQQKQKE